MEKAGYLMPDIDAQDGPRRRLAMFAIDDLTAEEEELLKYLADDPEFAAASIANGVAVA